jgi:ribose 5-phosphate isomerase A
MDERSRSAELEKLAAASEAARLVEPGMLVGLGSGSTVDRLVKVLAQTRPNAMYVVASPTTERAAEGAGLQVVSFDSAGRLDLVIDGADQVDPNGWLIKGGGAAHTREKILAAAANRFVVIVSADKLVERLQPPVPLELLPFGIEATISAIGNVRLRAQTPPTPDNGLIADFHGAIGDPRELARRVERQPGVIAHGLFPPELVDSVIVARDGDIEVAQVRGGGQTPALLAVRSSYGHAQTDPERQAPARSRERR